MRGGKTWPGATCPAASSPCTEPPGRFRYALVRWECDPSVESRRVREGFHKRSQPVVSSAATTMLRPPVSPRVTTSTTDADVIIVGAGPAGSATAAYLAMAGLDVLLLEKAAFPREKVCGDGLTPRAVRELITLGIPTPAEDGWIKNKGLRIVGGRVRLELPWPDLASFPPYGLVRTKKDFDDILAKHAVKHGARLRESTNVTGPILDERTGAIVGVRAMAMDADDGTGA